MANKYDIGDLVVLRGSFTDPENSSAYIDPTGVSCVVAREVDGVVVYTATYTYGVGSDIVKTAVGRYRLNLNASGHGTWHYHWYGTGSGQAAEEKYFYVKAAKATTTTTTTTAAP